MFCSFPLEWYFRLDELEIKLYLYGVPPDLLDGHSKSIIFDEEQILKTTVFFLSTTDLINSDTPCAEFTKCTLKVAC